MASEIIEEYDQNDDSYFIINKEAQKQKIIQLLKHQKNQFNSSSSSSSSSCSSYSLSSTGVTSCSSFDQNQSRKLLNLMKKGSTSLRRLFDMEHTSLSNHFEFYSGLSETITIPLWDSDSDDEIHDDPWLGIRKIDNGFIQEVQELQEHEEHNEHEEYKETVFRKQKLTRKKSYIKLPKFYKFRFRFRFRFRLRLRSRLRLCSRVWRERKREKKV